MRGIKFNKTIIYFIISIASIFIILYQLFPLKDVYVQESSGNELAVLCELTNDTEVVQYLYINDNTSVDEFNIMFANYENRDNHGSIQLQLIQDERISETVIDLETIKTDNSFYPIDFNYDILKQGKAAIVIRGIDTQIGSSVAVYCSKDEVGFNNVYLNGVEQDKSLVQKIEYSYEGEHTIVKYVLLVILILFILFTLKFLFASKKANNERILSLCSFMIIFLTFTIKYSFLVISPEPYAEQIVNFYTNAKNYGFFKNLILPDAGYLPLLQRFISWIVVNSILEKHTIFIMNVISLVVISGICSSFNLKYFNDFASSKIRFLISIFLPLFLLENYENLTFINFVYYGIILIIYSMLIDINKWSFKFFVAYTITVALFCLSKGFYIVLIPVAALIIIYKNKKLSKRELLFYGSILLTSSVQLLYSLRYQNLWLSSDNNLLSMNVVIDLIKDTILLYSRMVIGLFGIRVERLRLYELYSLGMFFLIFTLCIPLVLLLIRKSSEKRYFQLVILNIATLVECVLCVKTVPYLIGQSSLIRNRHEFFMIVSVFFTVFIALWCITEHIKSNYTKGFISGVLTITIYLLISNSMLIIPHHYVANAESSIFDFSSWNTYKNYIYDKSYCIPIKPNGWIYQNNISINYIGYGVSQLNGIQTNFELENTKVHSIDLQYYPDLLDKKIVGVFANRYIGDISGNKYKIVFKDLNEDIIYEIAQVNPTNKVFTGFLLSNSLSLSMINSIEFYDINNNEIYVKPQLYIITEN